MKRIILLFTLTIVLTGCYSKEAKELTKDKDTQARIAETIIKQGKEQFNIDLEPDVNRIKFTFPHGKQLFPIKTDHRIVIPVQTKGVPVYRFKVYADIYNEIEEKYVFNPDKVELDSLGGLNEFGKFLLSKVYKSLYNDALQKIRDFDPEINIKEIVVRDKYSYIHFEDVEELKALRYDLVKDYNAGYFNDPDQFEAVLKRQMIEPDPETLIYEEQLYGEFPCTAHISLEVEHNTTHLKSREDRMLDIVDYIRSNPKLPNGYYGIHLTEENSEKTSNQNRLYESVVVCR